MAACSDRYVLLRGGVTVPYAALLVAWDFERRGFTVDPVDDDHVMVRPGSALSDADVALIRRHKPALIAIARYIASDAWRPSWQPQAAPSEVTA